MSVWKQLLLSLVLVALAGGGWYAYRNPQLIGLAAEGGAAPEGKARPPAGAAGRVPGTIGRGGAVNVITAPVAMDEAGETVLALGTAKAVRSVTLFPQVTGVVTEILFTPGRNVEAGAVLVRLEDDEQRVALDRARVTLEQAQRTLERSQTLAKSRNLAVAALQEAELAAQVAEIEVQTAEIALSRRTITAPFAGATGLTDLSVGDLVTNTTAITTLDDLSTLKVAFEVPERWAGRVSLDQPVQARAQAVPGSSFAGRVTAIDNRVDETTRTLRLEAELGNPDGALKTGMAVNAELSFPADRQLAVPTLAVQWDRRGSFVWKLADGAARRAQATILRRESGLVFVQGDLQPGDKVVVEGIQRLREGAEVTEVDVSPTIVGEPGAAAEPGAEPVPAASAPAAGRARS